MCNRLSHAHLVVDQEKVIKYKLSLFIACDDEKDSLPFIKRSFTENFLSPAVDDASTARYLHT